MASLEDKILGEKQHNYCSSSEESESEEVASSSPPEVKEWKGTSRNTGPKGVKSDWHQFKQLENEKRIQQDLERIALAKKLTLTVQSALDEEVTVDEPDLSELLDDDDEFMIQYRKQRMQEMLQQREQIRIKKFGTLVQLHNGTEYIDAIDKENKYVTVIIHLYEEHVQACKTLNASLIKLAQIYAHVKFCKFVVSAAGMSKNFKINGVPALLVYKGGELIGNFVKISDDLGTDICVEDIRGYLVEHGMLEDQTCVPLVIQNSENDNK